MTVDDLLEVAKKHKEMCTKLRKSVNRYKDIINGIKSSIELKIAIYKKTGELEKVAVLLDVLDIIENETLKGD